MDCTPKTLSTTLTTLSRALTRLWDVVPRRGVIYVAKTTSVLRSGSVAEYMCYVVAVPSFTALELDARLIRLTLLRVLRCETSVPSVETENSLKCRESLDFSLFLIPPFPLLKTTSRHCLRRRAVIPLVSSATN